MLEVMRRLQNEFSFQATAPPESHMAAAIEALGSVQLVPFERCRQPQDGKSPAERNAAHLAEMVSADLVHGNSLSTGLVSGLVGESLGVPSLAHVREIERLSGARRARLSKNTRVVAVSHAVKAHLVAEGVDAGQIEVIHNGVDLTQLDRSQVRGSIRSELNLRRDVPLVATIGQISLRKATDVFLDAFIRCQKVLPDLHGIIVGARFSEKAENVEFERQLHEQVRRSDLTDRIYFLGWRSDVPAILRDIDVLVHTARQEPLGRVLLEAAAMATAVVATDAGGTAEIIDDGETGWLVPVDDAKSTAERLHRMLTDAPERERLTHAARRKAEDCFDIETCVRRTRRLCLEISGRTGG